MNYWWEATEQEQAAVLFVQGYSIHLSPFVSSLSCSFLCVLRAIRMFNMLHVWYYASLFWGQLEASGILQSIFNPVGPLPDGPAMYGPELGVWGWRQSSDDRMMDECWSKMEGCHYEEVQRETWRTRELGDNECLSATFLMTRDKHCFFWIFIAWKTETGHLESDDYREMLRLTCLLLLAFIRNGFQKLLADTQQRSCRLQSEKCTSHVRGSGNVTLQTSVNISECVTLCPSVSVRLTDKWTDGAQGLQ